MNTIIGLLRGVNVGGKNMLPMKELRALLESLKLREPQTYVQSGNMVFQTGEAKLERLTERIEEAIERKFRFRPPVILRTSEEIQAVVAKNPFPRYAEEEPGKLMVMFLAKEPERGAKEKLATVPRGREELKLVGRELFIFFPDGAGRSRLPWASLGQLLGTEGTGRNWNTVMKLLEMGQRGK